jgi:hypothetical protein
LSTGIWLVRMVERRPYVSDVVDAPDGIDVPR